MAKIPDTQDPMERILMALAVGGFVACLAYIVIGVVAS